jgi:glycosyltransferase involved in cell wall biosynthesis
MNNIKHDHNYDIKFRGGVTVLMALYYKDCPLLFERAVNSIYENSLVPDCFILVIDGPISKSLSNVVLKLKTKYLINVIQTNENLGLANALNVGLYRVKTDWVARADSDDINLPDRFKMQALAILSSKVPLDLLGGAICEIDPLSKKTFLRTTASSHEEIKYFISSRNPFNHMTVIFRRDLAMKCGGYPNIYLKEDYALWAKMISMGAQTFNLSDVLVNATTGKEMFKRRGGLKYAISEIHLQNYLVSLKIKSRIRAFSDGFQRSLVFLLPSWVRGLIYKLFLRTSN